MSERMRKEHSSAEEPQRSARTAAAENLSAAWYMGAGLFLFGMALGGTAGLSDVKGISQTLLSSLFTFAGGVLLSWAGFRRKSGAGGAATESATEFDLRTLGISLAGFSLGVMLGSGLGIWLRETVSFVKPIPKAGQTVAPFVMHAGEANVCADIRQRLEKDFYTAGAANLALRDLRELHRQACTAQSASDK